MRLRVDPFNVPKESRFPKDIEHIWNLLTKSEAVKKSPVEGEYECVDYALEVKDFLKEEHNIFSTIAVVSSSGYEHCHAVIAAPSYERRGWFFFDWNARPLTLAALMKEWDELIILRPGVNDKKFLQYPPSQKYIWYRYPPDLLKLPLREILIIYSRYFRALFFHLEIFLFFVEFKIRKKFKVFSRRRHT